MVVPNPVLREIHGLTEPGSRVMDCLTEWTGSAGHPFVSYYQECRPKAPRRPDLGFCVHDGAKFSAWLGRAGQIGTSPAIRQLAADTSLGEFLAEWVSPRSLIHRAVTNVWFEVDLHSDPDSEGSLPGINFTVAPDQFIRRYFLRGPKVLDAEEERELFVRTGRLFLGVGAAEAEDLWRTWFNPMQEEGTLLYFSFLPRRSTPQSKVYALMPRSQVRAQLDRFPIGPAWGRRLEEWLPGNRPLTVERSVSGNRLLKVGVELLSSAQDRNPSRYDGLLRGMVRDDCISAEVARSLQDWTTEGGIWYAKVNFGGEEEPEIKFYLGRILA